MKNIFLIILILFSPSVFSQEGAVRLMKMKSAKVVFLDLAGGGNRIVGVDNNGNSKGISIDNSLVLESNTLKVRDSYNTQTLSGTNIIWNLSNGTDLFITLTGNTTINMTNAVAGMTGTVWVTNATAAYTVTFAGYSNSIDPYIRLSSNVVTTSGGNKFDDFTFKYNGVKMNWNGTLNRQ